jgi:hypothetical protein
MSPLQNESEIQVALHASHAALSMVTLKISAYTNVALTLGWITLLKGEIWVRIIKNTFFLLRGDSERVNPSKPKGRCSHNHSTLPQALRTSM